MTDAYTTIAREAEAEIEVRRSRFRCVLRRVADETSARQVVDEQRQQHWDARHHCWAFVLGPAGEVRRSSDDGEPAGTAGAPMLKALCGSEQVSDVVAVVTRWFGGTLLGAGGLARAYGDAVRAALHPAGRITRELVRDLLLDLGHADAGRVEGELRSRQVEVLDVRYGDRVELRLGVRPEELARLHALVAELTSGTARLVPVGERWRDRR